MWGKPSGPLDAPLVVVARDFGWREQIEGVPLVGPSGKLLNRAMQRAGLARAETLCTNVCNTRPPADKWEAHARTDVERGVRELDELLRGAPRRLIVAMGNEAFRTLTLGEPRAK